MIQSNSIDILQLDYIPVRYRMMGSTALHAFLTLPERNSSPIKPCLKNRSGVLFGNQMIALHTKYFTVCHFLLSLLLKY